MALGCDAAMKYASLQAKVDRFGMKLSALLSLLTAATRHRRDRLIEIG